MTVFLDDGDVRLHQGDCLELLRELPAGSVDMVATSPPFYGLRDYGTGEWEGGDAGCDHIERKGTPAIQTGLGYPADGGPRRVAEGNTYTEESLTVQFKAKCGKCGARRVDRQIGLEETPDQWVNNLVAVFRECRRVLADHGTLWVEIGDSYAGGKTGRADGDRMGSGGFGGGPITTKFAAMPHEQRLTPGHKQKDLLGQPWLLAFALRADGWWLRSEIIWARPNPMPELVTDRPTKSHSTVFLLSKQPRYFYDQDAIREPGNFQPHAPGWVTHHSDRQDRSEGSEANGRAWGTQGSANARSVWQIPTEPTPFAHFATWPQKLVARMIQAGTSEHGKCPECGKPWVRDAQPDLTDVPTRTSTVRAPVDLPEMALYLREHRDRAGLTKGDVDRQLGTITLYSWFEGRPAGTQPPTPEQWAKLKTILALGDEFDAQINGTVEVEITDHGGSVDDPNVRRYAKAWNSSRITLGWSPTCACKPPGSDGLDKPGEWEFTYPPVPCTVLDPFAGSGTTLLVARNHGRHAIGIELNADYCQIAADRLAQLSLLT